MASMGPAARVAQAIRDAGGMSRRQQAKAQPAAAAQKARILDA